MREHLKLTLISERIFLKEKKTILVQFYNVINNFLLCTFDKLGLVSDNTNFFGLG